jgi:hypothetical protein
VHRSIHSTDRTSKRRPAEQVILPFPAPDPQPASPAEPPAMCSATFLEELEMRQDEVLEQLDELDRRIVALIEEVAQAREVPAA